MTAPTPHGYIACKSVSVIHKWFSHLSMFNGKAVWVVWPWVLLYSVYPNLLPSIDSVDLDADTPLDRTWNPWHSNTRFPTPLTPAWLDWILFFWSQGTVSRFSSFHLVKIQSQSIWPWPCRFHILSPFATSGNVQNPEKPKMTQKVRNNCNKFHLQSAPTSAGWLSFGFSFVLIHPREIESHALCCAFHQL